MTKIRPIVLRPGEPCEVSTAEFPLEDWAGLRGSVTEVAFGGRRYQLLRPRGRAGLWDALDLADAAVVRIDLAALDFSALGGAGD